MTVRADSPALHALIAADACFEQVATGLHFAEGPIWSRPGGFLLFTDIPASTIWQLDATGTSVWRSDTNMANGLALDREGRVVACEAATSVLSRFEHDGSRTVLATAWQGRELNSPNDVVVAPDGAIYFTDPHYGRAGPPHGVARPRFLDFQGVFRVVPGEEPELLVDDFRTPNGLAFSPDGSLLYIVDTLRMHVRVFDVQPGGGITGGRVLFAQQEAELDLAEVLAWIDEHGTPPHGLPDGLKVDEAGNVWVTGPEGIWVVSPWGERLGIVATPEHAANLVFGGPNGRTLYVCATHSVYRIPTLVRGA